MKNILFLIADDQRFDTIHALGNQEIKTPYLDRLVENGTAFLNAYIPGGSSGAVCMPSRAMIHTSQGLTKLHDNGAYVTSDQPLLGETLKKNGYHTIEVGKWHNGFDSFQRSFTDGAEIFFGGMWDHWNVPVNTFDSEGHYHQRMKNFTYDPFSTNKIMELPANQLTLGKHSTDLFSDALIEKIYQAAEKDEPFFLYGAFLAPHDPRTMPKEFQKMYQGKDIPLPPNFLGEHPFEFDVKAQRDEQLEVYPRPKEKVQQHLADYYAMISHIDARIGTILEALEKTNQLEDTLIIFTGDNGLAIGQHGLMGKQNLYESSIHVPLILSGPDIPKNKKVTEDVLLMDIFPTILDYLNLDFPTGIEGKSMLPLLNGKKGRQEIYLQFTDLIRGLKTPQYKLIQYATSFGKHTQLFDLKKDPFEMENLAENKMYDELRQKMEERLFTLAKETGDTKFDQGKIFWNR